MKYLLSLIFFLFVPDYMYALVGNPEDISSNIKTMSKLIQPGSPSTIISSIITYGIGIAGILGVIGITWGGITMIMAV